MCMLCFCFRGSWFSADFCWNYKMGWVGRGRAGRAKWYILGGYLFEMNLLAGLNNLGKYYILR